MSRDTKLKLIDKMHKKIWNMQGGASTHGMSFGEAEESDSFGYRDIAEKLFKIVAKELSRSSHD